MCEDFVAGMAYVVGCGGGGLWVCLETFAQVASRGVAWQCFVWFVSSFAKLGLVFVLDNLLWFGSGWLCGVAEFGG